MRRARSYFRMRYGLAKNYENLADTLVAFITLACIQLAVGRISLHYILAAKNEFLWGEVDEVADGAPQALEGSLRRLSQERLVLCEGVLDGIEVGAVGREVQEARAGAFNQFAHFSAFMAG